MDLPFDNHRVDPVAAVVESMETADFGDTGIDVDVERSGARASLSMTLESCEVLEGGAVWLPSRLQNGKQG